MKILLVCSANICRSAMAAEYMRARAAGEGLTHLVVDSAGLLGIEGEPPTREAVAVLREEGLDLTSHRSRGMNEADTRASDLIVVMTERHRAEITKRWPEAARRVVLLRAFENGPHARSSAPDVPDPIARPLEVYRSTFGTIRDCVDHLVLHLKSGL